ncbi:MAG: histidine phosphotransferase [Sphingomonas sp.]|nr:histidine phosphotransferase [Sphingomonas sp.]RZV50737.1 MAG: histidine phosphotransferase [Sphingomonadaceae bacterium]
MDKLDFSALLCSRLCHDLLSPVGAMNNGLELLADETDPEMREQVLELLNDSARAAASKLKFFRLAFGAAGGYGAEIDTAEAKAALEGLVGAEGKIELGWMVAEPKLPKDAVKLLLNIAMIVGDGLVRGGRLDVGAEKGAGKLEMVIRGEGPRLMIDPAIRDVLANGADDVEPRTSAAYLAHSLAAREEGTIQISAPDDQHIVVGATLPE